MESLIDDIVRLVSQPETAIETSWLEQAMAEHPYCTLPLLLYLERNGTAGNEELLSRLAIAWPDRRVLAMRLGDGVEGFYKFYPDEADETATADTDTTIDRFLNTYGRTSDKEIEALNAAIFNPTPDYADVLAAQEREQGQQAHTQEGDQQDALINSFIAEQQQHERQVAAAPAQPHVDEQEKAEIADVNIDKPATVDETMFSESLAKLYIKRHKYAQALEIIKNISLKYPEKSIYFADQIRFLKKLVLIETSKQQ